ncbi:hypothetical protein V2J09_004716 [Rumex salicifolius]
MEAKEDGGLSKGEEGVTVVKSDAPTDYHIAPRSENVSNVAGSAAPAIAQAGFPSPAGAILKKKRGRPRKYAPDGSLNKPLSPKPISSAAPSPVIDFSAERPHFSVVEKQHKVKPAVGSFFKQHKPNIEVDNSGEWVSCSVGANFTPHIITVNAGEDIMMKVISFSQQGPRAICILSANGVISSVTLRQPESSGGTLTYEGHFEILTLTGSFMPSESGGIRNRSGGMSVSLAGPDGRIVGGGIAGLLVAASPIQIVVGSFLSGNQHEQKPKKQKTDTVNTAPSVMAVPISAIAMHDSHTGGAGHHSSSGDMQMTSNCSTIR